jgi:hypothetical protein
MSFAFPSTGVNSGALRPGILQRISLYRGGSDSAVSLELSPIVKVMTRAGFYHFFAENDALVTNGAQGIKPIELDTPAVPGGLRISSGSYNSSVYRWGHQVFTLKQIQEFAARAEDITAVFAMKLQTQGAQHHAAVVGSALSTQGNYGSGLSVPNGNAASASLQSTFNSLLLASAADGADIFTGRWVAVCNLNTANVLLQKNEVQQMGYSIAAATVGGALAQARTGAADWSQLKAFFASKLICPVDFVCLPQFLPTAGSQTGTPVMTDGLVSIYKVAEANGDSGFIQTFTPDPNAALGQVISYDSQNPRGIAMYIESDYAVQVLGGTGNKWARYAYDLS